MLLHLSTGLAPGARIGVKVYSIPGGAPRSADVAGISIRGDTFRVDVANTGPTPLRPRGRVELRTPGGATVWSGPVPEFGLHPGVRRSLEVRVGTLPPAGPYVVLAVFDIGLPDLIAGEARIDVPPATRAPR